MNLTLYLSCLVVLFETFVWTARADGDFESDRARVIEIYGNPNTDQATRERNVGFLANFFDQHAVQIELSAEMRKRLDESLKNYKEEKAKATSVEGAPPQGGVFLPLVGGILIQLGIEAAYQGIKKILP